MTGNHRRWRSRAARDDPGEPSARIGQTVLSLAPRDTFLRERQTFRRNALAVLPVESEIKGTHRSNSFQAIPRATCLSRSARQSTPEHKLKIR